MRSYTLFSFHGTTMLVPISLVTKNLTDTIEKLKQAKHGDTVELTDDQHKEFVEAYCHPSTFFLSHA